MLRATSSRLVRGSARDSARFAWSRLGFGAFRLRFQQAPSLGCPVCKAGSGIRCPLPAEASRFPAWLCGLVSRSLSWRTPLHASGHGSAFGSRLWHLGPGDQRAGVCPAPPTCQTCDCKCRQEETLQRAAATMASRQECGRRSSGFGDVQSTAGKQRMVSARGASLDCTRSGPFRDAVTFQVRMRRRTTQMLTAHCMRDALRRDRKSVV